LTIKGDLVGVVCRELLLNPGFEVDDGFFDAAVMKLTTTLEAKQCVLMMSILECNDDMCR
jgi:hypothetical protein